MAAVPKLKTISFRPDVDLELQLEQLRSTMPRQQWAEVFTWLLSRPTVRAEIRERVDT